ncbi:MAG TPA: hypothetical protein H9831_09050 [Candidatus Eisenbergiella pullistercoris]|uniref:Uncharacterized protein n=1 Tax=Candidatus Eisenbergiella pullistercoris TaxID=2838555 RepID=A0A9D1YQ78_9FIRM|nr:hypothetical protein [Candidatus Eisenbergiella pullistercoris]
MMEWKFTTCQFAAMPIRMVVGKRKEDFLMKKSCAVFIAILLLSLTAACAGRTAARPVESTETESGSTPETETPSEAESTSAPAPSAATATAHADVLLTAPPEISLTDPLSSTYAAFTLRSGTSEWSWADKDGITSSIACGCAPLDLDPEQAATLDVPDYNRMDSVPYLLSCVILPDRVLLREWDIQDLGSTDAEPLSETQYSEALPIELKKSRVYELVAVWEEEKQEERSFWGEASYLFLTE